MKQDPKRTPENIESIIVRYEDTGETIPLTRRERSSNHFFPEFKVGDDVIQLRLDWNELDSRGQPMLDADFKDGATGKHRSIKGARRLAHHTETSPGNGRVYEWEFKEFSRQINVAITWRVSVTEMINLTDVMDAVIIRGANASETATLTDSCDAEIIRAADQKSSRS